MHNNTKYWAFTWGTNVSKKQLLNLFEENFKNISGVTLSKIYNKKAAMKYAYKEETRVKGPFYVGKKEQSAIIRVVKRLLGRKIIVVDTASQQSPTQSSSNQACYSLHKSSTPLYKLIPADRAV